MASMRKQAQPAAAQPPRLKRPRRDEETQTQAQMSPDPKRARVDVETQTAGYAVPRSNQYGGCHWGEDLTFENLEKVKQYLITEMGFQIVNQQQDRFLAHAESFADEDHVCIAVSTTAVMFSHRALDCDLDWVKKAVGLLMDLLVNDAKVLVLPDRWIPDVGRMVFCPTVGNNLALATQMFACVQNHMEAGVMMTLATKCPRPGCEIHGPGAHGHVELEDATIHDGENVVSGCMVMKSDTSRINRAVLMLESGPFKGLIVGLKRDGEMDVFVSLIGSREMWGRRERAVEYARRLVLVPTHPR